MNFSFSSSKIYTKLQSKWDYKTWQNQVVLNNKSKLATFKMLVKKKKKTEPVKTQIEQIRLSACLKIRLWVNSPKKKIQIYSTLFLCLTRTQRLYLIFQSSLASCTSKCKHFDLPLRWIKKHRKYMILWCWRPII